MSWSEEDVLTLVAAGLSLDEAALLTGVPLGDITTHIAAEPEFADRLHTALREGILTGGWAHVVPADQRWAVLAALASGALLRQAAEQASIPLPTLKRWRRRARGFERQLLAAARISRRDRLPTGITPLACPGPHCGTVTGYTYGCTRDACRTVKVDQVRQWRDRVREEEE